MEDVKKEESKQTESLPRRKPNQWARLAASVFFLMAVSGFLRFYGAIKQGATWREFGLLKSEYVYLIIAGLLYGLINLFAVGFILSRHRLRVMIAWIVALLGIGLYWIERLFLWSKDQAGINPAFMILLQLVFLLVLFTFHLFERKRQQSESLA